MIIKVTFEQRSRLQFYSFYKNERNHQYIRFGGTELSHVYDWTARENQEEHGALDSVLHPGFRFQCRANLDPGNVIMTIRAVSDAMNCTRHGISTLVEGFQAGLIGPTEGDIR